MSDKDVMLVWCNGKQFGIEGLKSKANKLTTFIIANEEDVVARDTLITEIKGLVEKAITGLEDITEKGKCIEDVNKQLIPPYPEMTPEYKEKKMAEYREKEQAPLSDKRPSSASSTDTTSSTDSTSSRLSVEARVDAAQGSIGDEAKRATGVAKKVIESREKQESYVRGGRRRKTAKKMSKRALKKFCKSKKNRKSKKCRKMGGSRRRKSGHKH